MIDFRPALAALAGVLLVAGCSGDSSVRSPDLPPPQLTEIGTLTCNDTLLAVGQTTDCRVSSCKFDVVDKNGNTIPKFEPCPALQPDSTAPNVASLDQDLKLTASAAGVTQISVTADGVRSPATTITVSAACGEAFQVTPAAASIVAGLKQTYKATLTTSDDDELDVTEQTTFTVTNPNEDPDAVTLDANVASSNADIGANTTVVITGTYNGPNSPCSGTAPLTNATALTVIPATVLSPGGICIEATPPATPLEPGQANCTADKGECVTEPLVFGLAENNQRQLQIRARFNNGTQCNVTDVADLSAAPAGIITINDAGLATSQAEGTAEISATFQGQTGTREAQVRVDQVLGSNSLAVSAREVVNDQPFTFGNAQRFACVGANDLVAGLGGGQLRGQLLAHARTRTCGDNELQDGACTALVFDGDGNAVVDPETEEQLRSVSAFNALQLQNDVTNPEPAEGEIDDSTTWMAQAGFWNGESCEITGSGGSNPNSPANVGDAFVDPRVLQLSSGNIPVDDPLVQPNGLVYADGAVRLGFTCVTATITNPLDGSNVVTDGMTVLILPIANDALLGASDDADRLCTTLLPAFSNPLLGALEGTPLEVLGRIELINTLSVITEIVNPALEQLDVLPLDQILTTLLEGQGDIPGLTALTQLIIQPLDQGLVSPVLEPLVCQVTNGINLLLGLLSGGGGNQECGDLPLP